MGGAGRMRLPPTRRRWPERRRMAAVPRSPTARRLRRQIRGALLRLSPPDIQGASPTLPCATAMTRQAVEATAAATATTTTMTTTRRRRQPGAAPPAHTRAYVAAAGFRVFILKKNIFWVFVFPCGPHKAPTSKNSEFRIYLGTCGSPTHTSKSFLTARENRFRSGPHLRVVEYDNILGP